MSEMRNSEVYLSQIELDEIKKMPKVYKTDNMLYRLTKIDALKLKENISPNKVQYEIITSALNTYLNERKNSYLQTSTTTEFLANSAKMFDKNKYANDDKLAQKFAFGVICCAISYFYNVPYNQISAIKNLEVKDLYRLISYEELDYINRIKKSFVDSGIKTPYASEADAMKFARQLGTNARKAFISKYKVDPLLIEKCEYIDDDIENFQNELRQKTPVLDNGRDEEL